MPNLTASKSYGLCFVFFLWEGLVVDRILDLKNVGSMLIWEFGFSPEKKYTGPCDKMNVNIITIVQQIFAHKTKQNKARFYSLIFPTYQFNWLKSTYELWLIWWCIIIVIFDFYIVSLNIKLSQSNHSWIGHHKS